MKKIILVFTVMLTAFNHTTLMAQEKIKQTAGRTVLGDFAPKSPGAPCSAISLRNSRS